MSKPNINPTTFTDFSVQDVPRLRLSENQNKVIQDKYLKESPSVEAWLSGVARNIAYGELLYHPASQLWGLFDGVRSSKKEIPFTGKAPMGATRPPPAPTTRYWLFHSALFSASARDENFARLIQNCETVTQRFPEARKLVKDWEDRFYSMLSSWNFLPNSPTLMNAGRHLQQLAACYVLPVEDSIEGITSTLQAQALIHKSGGGTGFSFGRLRPIGDAVRSTAGVASGVVSFMQVFDRMTEVVKQGGNRRGANMGILPHWHPEIKEFIRLKSQPGMLENFNLSVSVDQKFMDAVEKNLDYDLINPHSGEVTGQASAREVFDLIVESAWKSGDPGLVFIDRINASGSLPTPALGSIESTNPCGEQPLLPNEPCNLGSINIAQFVERELGHGEMDWKRLKETVHLAVRFLDNVIGVNNFPIPESEILGKTNRRIGLGVMGWAEALVKMGLPYDSPGALAQARKTMRFINGEALSASEDLAVQRGVFPNWKNSIYDPSGPYFRGDERFPRNCARTTIAPTGTIALAAGLQGAGIEPFFAIAYTRYNAAALEALQIGAVPDSKDVFFEVNPLFRQVAEANGFFGMTEKELWKKIDDNRKSVRGIKEIPAEIQALFVTSHDISVDAHVRMQAAFQEFTDNAVSKTVNLPHQASLEDVQNAYKLAYETGCKGITVYRDGSRQQQVLNVLSGEKRVRKAREMGIGVSSEAYEIKTGHGPMHVHIDFDVDGPFRLFASVPPLGTEISGLVSTAAILLSKYLEQGGDPNRLLKHLESIKSERPFGLGKNRIESLPHGIAVALRTHLQKHGWLDVSAQEEPLEPYTVDAKDRPSTPNLELWNLAQLNQQCPKCLSRNLSFNSCNGPSCNDCGYSECN